MESRFPARFLHFEMSIFPLLIEPYLLFRLFKGESHNAGKI
jgi:hypothetical protein